MTPPAPSTDSYKNPAAPIAERVQDLLQRMTLAEKVAQVTCLWDTKAAFMDGARQADPDKLAALHPHGIGQIARPCDNKGHGTLREFRGRDARATATLVNAIQRWAVEHTRLGIPVLFHEESLHGYAAVGATSFPQAIAMASSWDPALVRELHAATAREVSACGSSLALSPVLDVARDPRWGRIEETFGEDPHLVAEMSVAAIEGMQGPGVCETLAPGRVFATLKHLTGHGQPENGTNVGPAPIAERELREIFFPPFEAAVRRTGARAVMASYNEIDGVPSHANRWLLGDVLRGEWGFDGAVVADYFAIEQLHVLHHVAAGHEDAARLALHAGVDSDLPNGNSYRTLLETAQADATLAAQLDTAVARMLALKFRAGLFERPFVDVEAAVAATHTAESQALARRAAERCIVLLKNDGVLPFSAPLPALAVIGPNAAVARLGGYSGEPPEKISVLQGIEARLGRPVLHAEGVRITDGEDWWSDDVVAADEQSNRERIAQAVTVARDASHIVLVLGDDEKTAREAWATWHLGDRARLDLPGQQQELFDALHALGKPIVVVLVNGRPASVPRMAEQCAAMVEAWYLGEQGGHAIADMLFGAVNPGGKLPLSIARDVSQLPIFYNHKPSARRGYLFDETKPLFPFGWGLSYTQFELSAPRLSSPTMAASGTVQVEVDVRNIGQRGGDEVVQLYIRDCIGSVTRPVKELKAFERITLAAGEQRTLRFAIGAQQLQMWNAQMHRVVEPGEFEIMTGPNSQQLQSTVLTVTA